MRFGSIRADSPGRFLVALIFFFFFFFFFFFSFHSFAFTFRPSFIFLAVTCAQIGFRHFKYLEPPRNPTTGRNNTNHAAMTVFIDS
jgi:glucan phosphoethanolaminetransferase (alkaline phosphatase superfamily)